MAQLFTAGFLDRLLYDPGEHARAGHGVDLTLAQFKSGIARDLEALLNTRTAIPCEALAGYPECSNSILNYGLSDFSHLCLGSSVDRDTICAAVKVAIERHEPRLSNVSASLRIAPGSTYRVDLVISAMLQTQAASEPVQFDAQLDSATQQYSIQTPGAITQAETA
ncbi:MAG: type VI secretion system baseplate subunit TssE [Telluria sp.]|nr:type VI secretion system baseplate subunit TssE [Telluria sp.]